MKKLLSALAYAALLSPLSAYCAQQAFTGISGGLNIGMIQAETKLNQRIEIPNAGSRTPAILVVDFGNPAKLSDYSGTFGLTIGYSDCFTSAINWGVELRANWDDLKTNLDLTETSSDSTSSITAHTSARLTQQYAAIAKLGYMFNACSQVYAFIGPQWGNFKHQSYGSIYTKAGNQPVTVVSAGIKDEHKNYKAGLLVGLGLEQLINACTSIALEYDFTDYGHLNANKTLSSPVILNGVNTGTSFNKYHNVHFITNEVLLKFTYYYA